MPAKKALVAKKKGTTAKKSKVVDTLTESTSTMKVSDFNKMFELPYMIIKHMDHGQKLATVELLLVSVHCRHVHVEILPCGTVLEVKIVVPKLFYNPVRTQLANDDGSGLFNVNTNKAISFQAICNEVTKTRSEDTDEVGWLVNLSMRLPGRGVNVEISPKVPLFPCHLGDELSSKLDYQKFLLGHLPVSFQ